MKIKVVFFFTVFMSLSFFVFGENITFSADKMSGNAGENSDYTKLEGNSEINTAQMAIRADTIELSGKDFQYISASGAVSGNHIEGGFDFYCEKLTYDRVSKIALLEGNVKMEDAENEVVAESQFIEYNEKNDIAVLQIGINLKKNDSVCTAAFAIYRKKSKLLEMSGNTQVIRGDDTFRAQEIIFNIDTEEITMDGKVKGKVTDKNEG